MKRNTKKAVKGSILLLLILAITVFSLEYFSNYQVTTTIHADAPVITRKSIVINAPVEKVWKIFSDVDDWDTWQKEIVSPALNGQFKEGAAFDWKSNGLTIHSTLNNVQPNREVSWSGPAFGAFAIHRWHFSMQNGQTLVLVEESMEGWLVQLLAGKFQSGLDTSIDHWLAYLKVAAEEA
ncbi:SRPBCC family protein [Chitinophaga filiformis]|uniref:SRPBCC family protein n=1 Tax=Chitinophaga filiformis TaxID=104663 RepID=A0ABY4HXI4_CHIFI|nr:SRPBCC family protein [Chitinophaga filiformis]UPK68523.1 SRPBCC family protein [Chitinophaga filiformis]